MRGGCTAETGINETYLAPFPTSDRPVCASGIKRHTPDHRAGTDHRWLGVAYVGRFPTRRPRAATAIVPLASDQGPLGNSLLIHDRCVLDDGAVNGDGQGLESASCPAQTPCVNG